MCNAALEHRNRPDWSHAMDALTLPKMAERKKTARTELFGVVR
jgi:hypothetical protein